MNRDKLMASLVAILVTALETEPADFAESYAYLALGADMQAWTVVKDTIVGAGLATVEGHRIQLTEKGREIARKVQEAQKEGAA